MRKTFFVAVAMLPAWLGACAEELEACRRDVDCTTAGAICHPRERICYQSSLDNQAPGIRWLESPYGGDGCGRGCLLNEENSGIVLSKHLRTWGTEDEPHPVTLRFEGEDGRSNTHTIGRHLLLEYRYDTLAPDATEWHEELSWTEMPDDDANSGERELRVDPETMTDALLIREAGTQHRVQVKYVDLAGHESEVLSFIFRVQLIVPPAVVEQCEDADVIQRLSVYERNLSSFYARADDAVAVMRGRLRWDGRGFEPSVAWMVAPHAATKVTRARYVRGELLEELRDFEPMCGRPASYHIADSNPLQTCYEGALMPSFIYVDADGCEACASYLADLGLPHTALVEASNDGMAWEILLRERDFIEVRAGSSPRGYVLFEQQAYEWLNFITDEAGQGSAIRRVYDGMVVIDELELSFARPTLTATFGEGHDIPVEYAPECGKQRVVHRID